MLNRYQLSVQWIHPAYCRQRHIRRDLWQRWWVLKSRQLGSDLSAWCQRAKGSKPRGFLKILMHREPPTAANTWPAPDDHFNPGIPDDLEKADQVVVSHKIWFYGVERRHSRQQLMLAALARKTLLNLESEKTEKGPSSPHESFG